MRTGGLWSAAFTQGESLVRTGGLWSAECGVWSVECGFLWTPQYLEERGELSFVVHCLGLSFSKLRVLSFASSMPECKCNDNNSRTVTGDNLGPWSFPEISLRQTRRKDSIQTLSLGHNWILTSSACCVVGSSYGLQKILL